MVHPYSSPQRARDVDANSLHNSMQMNIVNLTPLEIFIVLKFIFLFVFFLDVDILIHNFLDKDTGQIRIFNSPLFSPLGHYLSKYQNNFHVLFEV